MNQIFINKPGKSSIIALIVPTGSRYEKANLKGISHFLEHMVFNGTKKRPNSAIISEAIEKYGGVLNAWTSNEETVYWIRISNKYLEKAKDVLFDFVLNPLIRVKDIEKEKKVIIQELNMYLASPSAVAESLLCKKLFPSNSGFNEDAIGTKNTLKNIQQKNLKHYHKFNNSKDNITFLQIGKEEDYNYNQYSFIPAFGKEQINKFNFGKKFYKEKDIEQSSIIIGNFVYTKENLIDNYFSFTLLNSIYNGMAGRLFKEIREKHGLVYSIQFFEEHFSCKGSKWNVILGLDKKNIDKSYDLIVKELTRPFTKKEIKNGITNSIGYLDMRNDNINKLFRTVVECKIIGLDYKEVIYNYSNHIRRMAKNINEFRKKIDFKKNILAGVLSK